ncbi:FitA-like ribbon-helix-helix domain-containing protein [Undibacterium sp. CCC3.4]
MTALTVRNLPDDLHRAMRMWAAQHGHKISYGYCVQRPSCA